MQELIFLLILVTSFVLTNYNWSILKLKFAVFIPAIYSLLTFVSLLSCSSLFVVFAFRMVILEQAEVETNFDHFVLEKNFKGADQKIICP